MAAVAVLPVAATLSLLSFDGVAPSGKLQGCWLAITIVSALITVILALSWLLPPIKSSADRLTRSDANASVS